jgi:hypothetical protein
LIKIQTDVGLLLGINLNRIKHFYRWLANGHLANVTVSNWDIPVLAQIKKEKSNRQEGLQPMI